MTPTFFSRNDCQLLFDKIVKMTNGGGDTSIDIVSRWSGTTQWARSRFNVAEDLQVVELSMSRSRNGAAGYARTMRLDDEGLRQVVADAEATLAMQREPPEHIRDQLIDEPSLTPDLWSAPTYALTPEARTKLAEQLMLPAAEAGLLTAGALRIAAEGHAVMSTDGMFRYYPVTNVECSMTVRDVKGTASGWAGVNHYALEKIDPAALAARALEKCLTMRNPSAVEPGRYTVILEPQAVADLLSPFIAEMLDRATPEVGRIGPFVGKTPGTTKITEQVIDRRLTLRADPMDPDGGFIPFERYTGTPYTPVIWIDRGILTELWYYREYALSALHRPSALLNSQSYRLQAAPDVPTVPVEKMIAKTDRGILITRLHGVQLVDFDSVLCSGYTRDGTWLIEHGKISKPVKNLRFAESPLFALNQLLDVGVSQRVFTPGYACVVPPLRVDDFNLAGLADAV